jgi:hypothetical protein
MKKELKPFFSSPNCFRHSGKKLCKARKQRASTFNVISVTLLASQTAAAAEVARRSMFVSFQHEADSEAALCQLEQYNDDLTVSLSPDREDPEVVHAAPTAANTPLPPIPPSSLPARWWR